jgi:hypothetical protein
LSADLPYGSTEARNASMFNIAPGKGNLTRAASGYDGYLPAHLGISAESLAALMNQHLEAARARFAAPPRRYVDAPRPFGGKGRQ